MSYITWFRHIAQTTPKQMGKFPIILFTSGTTSTFGGAASTSADSDTTTQCVICAEDSTWTMMTMIIMQTDILAITRVE